MIADASVSSDASARERPGPRTAVRKTSADAGPTRPNTSHTSKVKTAGGLAAGRHGAYLRTLRASRPTGAIATEGRATTSATTLSVKTDATATSPQTTPPVCTRTARTSGRSATVPAPKSADDASTTTSRHCGCARSAPPSAPPAYCGGTWSWICTRGRGTPPGSGRRTRPTQRRTRTDVPPPSARPGARRARGWLPSAWPARRWRR